jgi:hypothetical protein
VAILQQEAKTPSRAVGDAQFAAAAMVRNLGRKRRAR